jgi:sulfite reductase (ferredoxin)
MPPQRGQGQWALGHREPLNQNERVKRDDDGLNAKQRIIDRYQYTGFDSIDPADLRNRFRWLGLYTQRAPGIPGGRTAVLEPEELEDRYFMLRVRIDGGTLSSEQLTTIANIATEFGRDVADVTDRQDIQLHWIRIEDVPEIWRRLEAVGLDTTEACGDTPRVILGCPLAGVAKDEVLDATPALREVRDRYIGDPEFSNLPRKYKSSISGCAHHCTNHEINDISFVGVTGPDGLPGFDLWVGGGLSTNPKFGQRLGAFVEPDRVAEVWAGVTAVFREHGYRRSRQHARLKFLLADWGVAKFREVLEKEYLGRAMLDGPAPDLPNKPIDHIGVHKQVDGQNYVGAAPVVGRTSGTQLGKLADLAQVHGSERLRLTPYQKLLVLDIADDHVEPLIAGLRAIGLEARPSAWRRGTMACTGIEYCKLAIVETKARGEELVARLEERLKDFDADISIHLNGCPNACARTQVADIGLKGQLVLDADGNQVEGYQVHLGGGLGLDPTFGRKLRAHKVTSTGLDDYITNVVTAFLDQRVDDEAFATWVARADDDALRGEVGTRELEAVR